VLGDRKQGVDPDIREVSIHTSDGILLSSVTVVE